MPGIEIVNLSKTFGDVQAVREMSLTIEEGALFVLLGPSGCGKTTALNCLAGLESVTSGRIRIGGVDVTDLPPHARNIAMVFQSSLLYPHLTGRQNIQMSLKRTRTDPAEVERRIAYAVDILEIGPVLDKKPGTMSGGQRQRVAMAKAIVRKPDAFLLDEPLAALDASLRQSLRSELVALQKRLATTMLFVTHDQVEAMTMGDSIAVMQDGAVEQVGTPAEIYNAPRTKFVAGFIGSPSMNFFEGRIREEGGEVVFQTAGGTFGLPRHLHNGIAGREDKYTLAVRPQHMRVELESRVNAVEATVYAIENLGKEAVLIVRDVRATLYRALIPPDHSFKVQDVVHIVPELDSACLFTG